MPVSKIQEVVPASNRQKPSPSVSSQGKKSRCPPKPKSIGKEQTQMRRNYIMGSNKFLSSISGSFFITGIKYFMYSLHLLCHRIFRKKYVPEKPAVKEIVEDFVDSNLGGQKNKEEENKNMTTQKIDENVKNSDVKNQKEKEGKKNSFQSETENASPCDKDSNEICKSGNEGSEIIGKEDTNASNDMSCTTISKIMKNESIDTDRSTRFAISEELMEISVEERSNEKSQIVMKTMQENYDYLEDEESSSSLDREVASIFQNYNSLSDDDYSKNRSFQNQNEKRDRARKNLRNRKKTPFEYTDKILSFEKDETKDEMRSPVKGRNWKQRDVEYKEVATQTNDAFSNYDDELIPMNTNPKRQFCSKQVVYDSQHTLYQNKEAEQELNYVNYYESSDEFARSTPRGSSADSTVSSLSDFGFDYETFLLGPWNIPNRISGLFVSSRAPPGFPIIPQYPPLFLSDKVPPAPAPMRHLYYEYPEFMDLPQPVPPLTLLDVLNCNYQL
ncbi:uncharacterized protein LOC144476504 isoform X2 [Augochlora pura]